MSLNTKEIPDVCFEYWSTVNFMLKHPFMYGMDSIRAECHERLCSYYKLNKKKTKSITDNMDKYETAYDFHVALKSLIKRNRDKHV